MLHRARIVRATSRVRTHMTLGVEYYRAHAVAIEKKGQEHSDRTAPDNCYLRSEFVFFLLHSLPPQLRRLAKISTAPPAVKSTSAVGMVCLCSAAVRAGPIRERLGRA